MIHVLSSKQIRKQDQLTIANEPIKSIDLMERASNELCEALLQNQSFSKVLFFCGPGNNGGDGLAMARILSAKAKEVRICIPTSASYSKDFAVNLERLPKEIAQVDFDVLTLKKDELIVDAIFGTGLDRPIEGIYANWVSWINKQSTAIVAVDMPSGMPDRPQWELSDSNCVHAALVLTLQYPKLSLLLPYSANFVARFELVDIGLYEYTGDCNHLFVEKTDVSKLLKPRNRFTHKYKEGAAMLLGGSLGKTGSIVLASEAAFRAGAGLVHAHIPKCVLYGIQQYLPEVMYSLSGQDYLEEFPSELQKISALGLGPGLGLEVSLVILLQKAFKSAIPLVIDADALRLIAEHQLESQLPQGTILTPHEGEFSALVGSWENEQQKLEKLMAFSEKHEIITVLKGAYTIICDGKQCYFNSSGHAAMATAGSGDVLLGIITSLLAQKLNPLDAAIASVYLHGYAAELYLNEQQSATLMASDITKKLGSAIHQFSSL